MSFITNTTILLAPAITSTLFSLLVLIPNVIPKESELADVLLNLKKDTIKERGAALDRFNLRQFEESAANSIMDLSETHVNSVELFKKIDHYTDYRSAIIRMEKIYSRNALLMRICLIVSVLVLAISQVKHLIVQQIIFIVGLLLLGIFTRSFIRVWVINKKAYSIKSSNDFI